MKALPRQEKPLIFSIKSASSAMGTGANSYVINSATQTPPHSTVTLLAKLRGLSTSVPRAQAV